MPDADTSDGELMHAVNKEDTSALVHLIERWETRLLAFIYRYVQNEAVARDLVQETFVRIYRARKQYDPAKPFTTWMFSIAANLCRNHQRWVSRHKETSLETLDESADPGNPVSDIIHGENQQFVAKAVASLPHTLRIAVILYYYEDKSYREIADITDCSPRGVESRLYRARKILVRKLQAFPVAPAAAVLPKGGHLPV